MPHDVFISYSTSDTRAAMAIYNELEVKGIPCWMAPKKAPPGTEFAGAITEAIEKSRVVVFIFSSNSNCSSMVVRELHQAAENDIPILPFRLEDCATSKSIKFYIGPQHWLDAINPPLEERIQELIEAVKGLLVSRRTKAPRRRSNFSGPSKGRSRKQGESATRPAPANPKEKYLRPVPPPLSSVQETPLEEPLEALEPAKSKTMPFPFQENAAKIFPKSLLQFQELVQRWQNRIAQTPGSNSFLPLFDYAEGLGKPDIVIVEQPFRDREWVWKNLQQPVQQFLQAIESLFPENKSQG
jgi:hypothetical protein